MGAMDGFNDSPMAYEYENGNLIFCALGGDVSVSGDIVTLFFRECQ
jgi:hypothetical protein